MDDDSKNIKIVFAPGSFDDFDGTQEELDELISEIKRMAESGELFEQSRPLELEDLADLPDDFIDMLSARMEDIFGVSDDPENPPHTLH